MNFQNDHWNYPSNFTEYIPIGIDKRNQELIVKVLKISGCFFSRGIVLVLDKKHSSEYPEPSIWYNKLGLYINAKKEMAIGGICWSEDNTTVSKLIKSKRYEHIIWLPRKTYSMSEEDLVWNLSHEIRHMRQSNICHALLKANNFLYETLLRIETVNPKAPNKIPTELDADREAWFISRQVFEDEAVADQYVENNLKSGDKIDDFNILHSKFKNAPDFSYNVCEQMITFLKKHEKSIKKLQNNPKIKPHLKKDQFNVDEICKELSNVSTI